MSLYIVEDDDDNVLDSYGEFDNSVINATLYDEPIGAERDVDEYGGHVVELLEAPAKVVVSEGEAKMLERAKDPDSYGFRILYDYANQHGGYLLGNKEFESRLLRAYVNGWVAEQPKRWNVKVPHTKDVWYFKASEAYLQTICPADDKKLRGKFTESEIEHYGLQDCEKEEVADDEV